ncbi:MAG: AAA family ATPase, partial [Defluviitaleaceae bacterium]|nr:AAA family ATPase [Defluviitaleaceae bacterium]
LTEMSGFASSEGIVVIAATNRLDTLDEALLRPGRFDRHVEVALPDIGARKAILEYHAANKPLSEDIDLETLARKTIYFSGAMLENLLNEAAILAAKASKQVISYDCIDRAFMTIIAGAAKTDLSHISEAERRITAYHEAGHALASRLVAPETTVAKVSIIPSTRGAGGFCMSLPQEKMYYTKRELEAQIKIAIAGRASEEIIFGAENVTTGASSDIERASLICKDYIAKYAMGTAHGLLNLEVFGATTNMVDECKDLLERLYRETLGEIQNNLPKLHALADELLAKEMLEQEDVERLAG